MKILLKTSQPSLFNFVKCKTMGYFFDKNAQIQLSSVLKFSLILFIIFKLIMVLRFFFVNQITNVS